jgi:hypothetical protein
VTPCEFRCCLQGTCRVIFCGRLRPLPSTTALHSPPPARISSIHLVIGNGSSTPSLSRMKPVTSSSTTATSTKWVALHGPFYQATVSGPFSTPGTPIGLIETSGADLTSLNVNVTPALSIRAVLPYEVQAYPAFPFEFGSPNTGYLEWELVRASDNAILSSGNSLLPFGTNSCGLPTNSPNACAYETSVSVSGLAPGNYQIRGRIIPPGCPGSGGSVTPIPTSPLNFTVAVGTGLASSAPAKPIIRTTPMAWQIEGVSGPIALYDAQGRRVWSGTPEQNTILIPRQNLSPGLYVLVAETPAGPSVHRLLHLTQ